MTFPEQIIAGDKILDVFMDETYVCLLAQMQSGKTGTYMYVACEMLRRGLVNQVIIFSGNREIELREQTEDSLPLEFITQIKVIWGPQLKTYIQTPNTLYIWDESHYGQSHKQEVDKFLTRLGLQATGTKNTNGDFLLSVSATPFSELSDDFTLNQNKCIVRLRTSDDYLSIAEMKLNHQIKPYSKLESQFLSIMQTYDGFGIVRVSDNKKDSQQVKLKHIAKQNGWETVCYDMSYKGVSLDTLLATKPKKTVIFLKGMIRMGKQLNKNHVSFCMETSISNTDTMLQGLLGRCCGYGANRNVHIYLREKPKTDLFKELDLFISLHEDNLTSIPHKGANLTPGKERKAIIPLRITIDDDSDREDNIAYTIIQKLELHQIESKNSPETTAKIMAIVERITMARINKTPEKEHFKGHFKGHEGGVGFVTVLKEIRESFDKGIPRCEFGSGYGVAARVDEIAVFMDTLRNHIYITAQLPYQGVPATTGREVFCRETAITKLMFAGNLTFKIKPSCATDADVLYNTLDMCSELAQKYGKHFAETPMKMTSNGGDYKGITLTPQVFDALQHSISDKLKAKGIRLAWKKAGGRPSKMVRLTEISWSF